MNENTNPNNEPNDEQVLLPFDPSFDERTPTDTDSEIDALRTQNAELQLRLRQREAQYEMTQALRSAGARSPALLFEAARPALQFSEDGAPENIESVVADMKQRFPEQFAEPIPASIDGGAGRGASPAALTRDALARMTPDEISRLDWVQVRQALSN